jgi:hypothetical protein
MGVFWLLALLPELSIRSQVKLEALAGLELYSCTGIQLQLLHQVIYNCLRIKAARINAPPPI